MQDVVVVQRLEAEPDLAHDLQRLADGEPVDLEPVRERALVGVRHDEVGPAVVELTRVVHRHHVRRLDLAEEPSLLDEPAADVVVLGPVVRQHLDRDGRVELLVVGEPDGGEAAGADPPPNDVPTEARGHGHGCIMLQSAGKEHGG